MGIFTYDSANDMTWFFGAGYNAGSSGNDSFVVNRRNTASTAFQSDTANYTDSDVAPMLLINSAGRRE